MFHEALGGDDLDLARVDIVLGHHPLDPAEVIDMAVGVDHRGHWPVTAVFAVQRQPRGSPVRSGILNRPFCLLQTTTSPIWQAHSGRMKSRDRAVAGAGQGSGRAKSSPAAR